MELRQPEASVKSRFPDGFRILKGKQEYITYVDHSSIRIWASALATHYDTHMHSAIEIIMPYSGASTYQLADETYEVRRGEILFIPSGYSHSLTESSETVRHLLLFEPSPLMNLSDVPSIEPLMRKPIYLQEDNVLRREVADLLSRVIDCYSLQEPMWNLQCYSYLLMVYALLGREYLRHASPKEEDERLSIDSPIMNSAITYINEHYMEDISLEQVAAFAGFSKYYFSRTFKSFAGMSFSDFLTQRRLTAASDLLVRTNQSIQHVATSSGFASTATFNRVFRDHKNCTPTQYRAIYSSLMMPDPNTPVFEDHS